MASSVNEGNYYFSITGLHFCSCQKKSLEKHRAHGTSSLEERETGKSFIENKAKIKKDPCKLSLPTKDSSSWNTSSLRWSGLGRKRALHIRKGDGRGNSTALPDLGVLLLLAGTNLPSRHNQRPGKPTEDREVADVLELCDTMFFILALTTFDRSPRLADRSLGFGFMLSKVIKIIPCDAASRDQHTGPPGSRDLGISVQPGRYSYFSNVHWNRDVKHPEKSGRFERPKFPEELVSPSFLILRNYLSNQLSSDSDYNSIQYKPCRIPTHTWNRKGKHSYLRFSIHSDHKSAETWA